jgi:mannosyltransferase
MAAVPPQSLKFKVYSQTQLESVLRWLRARTDAFYLVAAILVATLLRLDHLGGKLFWMDEAASVAFAKASWPGFWIVLSHYEENMALYYLLLRGWIHLGDSEVIVRLFSILCAVATLPAIYRLGSQLFSRRTGLIASALLAVHAFHIEFSQEARSYSLLLLLLVWSGYFFARSVEYPQKKKYWAAYIAFSVLAVYCHAFALLVIPAAWASIGRKGIGKVGWKRTFLLCFFQMLLSAPMLWFLLTKNVGQIAWVPFPSVALLASFLNRLCGRSGLAGVAMYVGLGLLVVVSSLRGRGLQRGQSDSAFPLRFVFLCLFFPLAVTYAASFVKPVFYFRFLIIVLPAAILIAAEGLSRVTGIAGRKAGVAMTALLLAVSMGGEAIRIHKVHYPGDDWRSTADFMLQTQRPGDVVIFYIPLARQAADYYIEKESSRLHLRDVARTVFPEDRLDTTMSFLGPSRLESVVRGATRVWVVVQEAPVMQSNSLRAELESRFRLILIRKFNGSLPDSQIALYLYGKPLSADKEIPEAATQEAVLDNAVAR